MMVEANKRIIDSNSEPALESLYLSDRIGKSTDTIPWANLFFCHSFAKADSLSGDTLLVLLDTRQNVDFGNVNNNNAHDFWVNLKSKKKFNKCKVVIPCQLKKSLKNLHYKYCSVQLVTDDSNR